MTVVCVMLSRRRGGLEQSLIDYCEALRLVGARVAAVVDPGWPERTALDRLGVEHAPLSSLNEWDPLAVRRLRQRLQGFEPAAVLTIGRRASGLVRRARRRMPGVPQVAPTPSYHVAPLVGLDHVLATTEDLRRALLAAGQPAARITVVPNLVRVPAGVAPRPHAAPAVPVIGALGRFVPKKGFAQLIEALTLLRARGLRFELRLGGSGPEEPALRAQVAAHGLTENVRFLGWVTDKRTFFDGIDVFCLPSLHEPFGIVLLESLAHATAVVATATEGPREIVTDGVDGLLVPPGDPGRMADALAELIGHDDLALALARAGFATARGYDLPVVAGQIGAVLRRVIEQASG